MVLLEPVFLINPGSARRVPRGWMREVFRVRGHGLSLNIRSDESCPPPMTWHPLVSSYASQLCPDLTGKLCTSCDEFIGNNCRRNFGSCRPRYPDFACQTKEVYTQHFTGGKMRAREGGRWEIKFYDCFGKKRGGCTRFGVRIV